MAKHTIERDDGPSLQFEGELIGKAYNSSDRGHSNFSGTTGRSWELRLYKTASGKFVCQRIGNTQWQGEHDTYEAEVFPTHVGVIEFFGDSRLAKELYADAGIEYVQAVD